MFVVAGFVKVTRSEGAQYHLGGMLIYF